VSAAALLARVQAGVAGRQAEDRADLADALAALARTWGPDGDDRAAFLASAPEARLGLSRPMIAWALDRFARAIAPARAGARVARQLAGHAAIDGAALHPEPLGTLLLVVSGNVFTGPAEALLAALATGNGAVVKRPSGPSGEFVERFVASLARVAPTMAGTVVLASWPGGADPIEGDLAGVVDGILVAGDAETIAAYRRLAPATTPLIEFGPRASVAVVSRAGYATLDADALARDVGAWDQLACSAAQVVYVEGEPTALTVAEALAAALARLETALPSGSLTLDERIEIARFRHEAGLGAALGTARLLTDAGGTATVVYERDPVLRASPLRRSVRVKRYADLDELRRTLAPARPLLHSAGLAVGPSERAAYERALAAVGLRRLCPVGSMNEPSAAGVHDGMFELQRLVRWVECVR
jgi:hypothetical protein